MSDSTQRSARPAAKAGRPYDVVLFGATGFTGQLVAEYLARRQATLPGGLRWALGGRSRDKLERVRSALAQIRPELGTLPLLLADSDDEAALARIAESTRVVCTTVGPYVRHGKKLLAACAAAGTDCCDLTGEVPFIRWAIDTQDARAQQTGARLVSCCGFDSLPSDLGVFMLSGQLQAQGTRLAAAKLSVERIRGGFSGGTFSSILDMLDEAGRDRGLRRLLADPYALVPGEQHDPRARSQNADRFGVRWDDELQRWTAPFLMAGVNTRVVHRSNALRGFAYGRGFRYSEVMSSPRGPKGLALATAVTGGMGLAFGLASLEPTRRLLASRLPAPGQGPSPEEQRRGMFRIRVLGTSEPDAVGRIQRAEARIEADGDPGYSETSKMLSEAALCLAFDDLPARGGVLTPSVCMGQRLIERLRQRQMVWSVSAA